MTERERQRAAAMREVLAGTENALRKYRYRLIDGRSFEAIALTEAAAWRVLNAEHPHMAACYLGKDDLR